MYTVIRSDDEPDIDALTERYRQMRDDMLKRTLDATRYMMRKSNRKTYRVQAEIARRELERRAIQAE